MINNDFPEIECSAKLRHFWDGYHINIVNALVSFDEDGFESRQSLYIRWLLPTIYLSSAAKYTSAVEDLYFGYRIEVR
jgi:hypothetical protein